MLVLLQEKVKFQVQSHCPRNNLNDYYTWFYGNTAIESMSDVQKIPKLIAFGGQRNSQAKSYAEMILT